MMLVCRFAHTSKATGTSDSRVGVGLPGQQTRERGQIAIEWRGAISTIPIRQTRLLQNHQHSNRTVASLWISIRMFSEARNTVFHELHCEQVRAPGPRLPVVDRGRLQAANPIRRTPVWRESDPGLTWDFGPREIKPLLLPHWAKHARGGGPSSLLLEHRYLRLAT